MCQVLLVSKSGFYKWLGRKPSNRTEMNKMITQQIKQIYTASKCRYGSPRIAKELKVKGVNASEPLVAKLMAKAQLRSIIRKKYVVTTDSSHSYPIAENKLNQQFEVTRQNEVWVSDITYIETKAGWQYLTTVIDLFDRKVLAGH
jgi:transposase InsO family protein